MKRSFSHLLSLLLPFGLLCSSWGGEIEVRRDGENVVLQFPEDMVGDEVAWASRQSEPQRRSVACVELQGNDAYRPDMHWAGRRSLCLRPKEGTPSGTRFSVHLKEGTVYRSGKPATSEDVSVTFYPSCVIADLGVQLPQGCGAVLRSSVNSDVKLRPEGGLRFTLTEQIRKTSLFGDDSFREGRTIGAHAEPATLRHGMTGDLLKEVVHLISPASLKEDTPLPGCLLVVPDEPLPANTSWILRYETEAEAEKSKEGKTHEPLCVLHSLRGLHTELKTVSQTPGETELELRFSSPLRRAEAEKLFRTMVLRAGAANAAPQEPLMAAAGTASLRNGALSRTIQLGEQSVRISYLGQEQQENLPEATIYHNEEDAAHWRYDNKELCSSVRLKVQADMPCTLELALPAGCATSVLGIGVEEEMIHRLSHGAHAPHADVCRVGATRLLSLPRGGKHDVRITTGACAGLQVRAHYWTPAEVVAQRESLAELMNSRYPASPAYHDALGKARERAELTEAEGDDEKTASERRRYERSRERLLRTGRAAGSVQLNAPDGRRLTSAEWPLDVDALAGGKAAPGLYLLHLRALPNAAACAAAASLGLKAEDVTEERDIWVQVTGLSLLPDSNVVALQHLEDGTLPAQAVLYRTDTKRPLSVVNGYADPAALPAPEEETWYVAQEGDDVCMAPCTYDHQRVYGKDRRLFGRMLSDRTHYRPGEEVHLFGMLREVCGDESRVAREKLYVTVTTPGGSPLAGFREMAVRPDAYGCFELSFTLPEEGEDVTGRYQCEVFAKPYTKIAETEVQCEVFRRDAFEIEFESDLPLISPQQYSCTVKARDYNGSPLAGAKVELKLSSDLALQGGHKGEAKEDDDTAPAPCVLTATVRTDAQGCAHFSCPVSLPQRQGIFTPECGLMAEVAVTNDRGEVKRATAVSRASYADFRVELKGKRLTAFRQPEKAGDARNRLLPRRQTLHAVLRGSKEFPKPLPNGFVRMTTRKTVLWSGDVCIPAHAVNGVELPWDEEVSKSLLGDAVLELTGADGAGRTYRSCAYFPQRRPYDDDEEPVTALTLTHKEGTSFTADAAEGGEVCVLLQSRGEVRTALRRLQAGKQELSLPEAEGLAGKLRVSLLHPLRGEDGLYREMETAQTDCFLSDTARRLDIAVDMPAEPSRPGAELTLCGRVSRHADGKPADARVLLFAVDKGMLSIGGKPVELPNWEEVFTSDLSLSRLSSTLTLPKSEAAASNPRTLDGLWRGERRHKGRWGWRFGFDKPLTLAPHDDSWGVFDVLSVLLPFGQQQQQYAASATPCPVLPSMAPDALPPWILEEGTPYAATDAGREMPEPRLRSDFRALAVWAASLTTDREGGFETTFTLPDTLTTYTLFCVAADEDGGAFGNHTEDMEVSQPVMLTPGTPLFMSTGDRLLLPLTVTNGTKQEDTWKVSLSTGAEQSIRLAPKATGTLFFELAPQEEGECVLRWEARAESGSDAVEGRFPVRYPAPLLKETHRVVLCAADDTAAECRPAALLSSDLANSTRGELVAELSANPLLHLAGCANFVLEYPYGCTEQTATALLPWMLYERLAPVCPQMAAVPAKEAKKRTEESIDALFERQQRDGGLAYWPCCRESCFWASAHAALVLTLAQEQGFSVPRRAYRRLCAYLRDEREHLRKAENYNAESPLLRYEVARVLGERKAAREALTEALAETEAQMAARAGHGAQLSESIQDDVCFLLALQGPRAEHHAAFLAWLRSQGRATRHPSTWSSAWALLALNEYLSTLSDREPVSRVTLADGRVLELGQGVTELPLAARGQKLGGVTELIRATEGTAYITVRAKAQPSHTSYAGCSDKGLKLTRRYEVQGANGQWHAATSFAVGDVVRVTLTCTKGAKSMHYLVLEDYLPSCMEAVNPDVPSQAAGIDFAPWSECFDNREYLTDRVRGFCSCWDGNKPVTMVYYARVKRAGTSVAAPAQAQLMYEPQIYALTPNTTVTSRGE